MTEQKDVCCLRCIGERPMTGNPPWWRENHIPIQQPFQPMVPLVPVGCICPPGANKDCERPDCPRKNPSNRAGAANG
jgi:hypothetical protein